MRRIAQVLLVIFLSAFIFVCLYAFIPQVKAYVDGSIGPSVHGFFGDLGASITNSAIWQHYIVPWPNQLIIGCVLLGFPIAYLFHASFNRVRTVFVRSAAKESGQTIYTEPISQTAAPQPVPIAKPEEEKKAAPAASE